MQDVVVIVCMRLSCCILAGYVYIAFNRALHVKHTALADIARCTLLHLYASAPR